MAKIKDITGQKFGRLTAMYHINGQMWHWKCDCGEQKDIRIGSVKSGYTQSCGCLNKERTSKSRMKDLTGQRFGRLTIIKKDHSEHGNIYWLCHCDCGNDIILKTRNILYDGTKSCGCLRREITKQRMRIDLTGKQFNNWTVIKRDEQTGMWLCRCKCGTERLIKTQYLTTGIIKGCGCQNFAQKTNRIRIFKEKKQKWKDFIIPLFSFEEYCEHISEYDYQWNWKCVKCGEQFKQHIHTTGFNKQISNLPRCPKCFPFLSGYSNKEKQLADWIKTIYKGKIEQNNQLIINPYQLDIYFPELKLAIEFNGLYWHSDNQKRIFNNYHILKTQKCEQLGIHLIHIFEDEWDNHKEIIKDKIKYFLGLEQIKIYARKCTIKQISVKQKNQFLNNNHIQGQDKSNIKLGLFYQKQLVAVMTFGKPRFDKIHEWELIRYATKIGYRIIGGAGKLLSYFIQHKNPNDIISYADRRYSQGKLYKAIGFKLDHISKPNYRWTKGSISLSRYECQKKKLKKILGQNFKKELSEQQNMQFNGWNKIYDCGNMIFIWQKS